ncbi:MULTISPECIES: RloB domain-containing protein [unclassified Endozoicomonas]|uniref:RloB domain-containing protein n=1 Tax=unclassified Endozoicomonas TaxID=2644528 RepID=UPI003BB79364
MGTHDELCLVIDRDQQAWEEKAISEIAKACDQKQYLLALSNPAFDLWLLLHHLDVYALAQETGTAICQ